MKWPKPALAGAAALITVVMTGITPLPAKADIPYASVWRNADSAAGCLGVLGGDMTNGTPVVQWPCNGHPDQTWQIHTANGSPGGPLWTEIQSAHDPGKCLGVLGSATSDGSSLVIWDCNGSTDQLWQFQFSNSPIRGIPTSGCFNIVNFNAAPKVMGVLGGSTTPGAPAVLWDFLPAHADQYWCAFLLTG